VAGDHLRQARAAHRQLTLKLAPDPGYERENFFISQSNQQAFAMVELWPSWPDTLLILTGPAGAGKSHLGAIWAARASAAIHSASALAAVDVDASAASGPLFIEDADAIGRAEAQLFHLVNLMRERGQALVLTARTKPDCWNLRIADLLSRLRLAPSVAIGAPDDELMQAVLLKLLIERQLVVDTGIISYVALRLERSLDAARSFVDVLDREALARQSRITKVIAGDVLSAMRGAENGCG
jgi:chromosomal replication initiation ATPase DnaA